MTTIRCETCEDTIAGRCLSQTAFALVTESHCRACSQPHGAVAA